MRGHGSRAYTGRGQSSRLPDVVGASAIRQAALRLPEAHAWLYHPIVALTKRQRNELFSAVAEAGINAAEFDLQVNKVERAAALSALLKGEYIALDWFMRISHVPSESSFTAYRISESGYSVYIESSLQTEPTKFFVWQKIAADPSEHQYPLEWPYLVHSAAEWANGVKYYVDTPDLWDAMHAQRELLAEASSESLENTPFTSAERAAISAQLNEIKNYLKESLSLTREQFAEVEARIDEAEAASRRLRRKDWLLLFLGTTVTLYITDMVPATAVQHITALVLQGLGHLFGIGGGPPPLAG